MYAVIQTGGKQYRVAVGDVVQVETLPVAEGASVELDRVMLVSDGENTQVGSPYLDGTTVGARVRGHGRGPKIRVFRMRRRKNSRRSMGHRQNYTELEITSIAGRSERPADAGKAAE